MILDYNYNSNKKNFSISYITETGGKKVLNFNVTRFKSYYKTPTGKYTNWDGCKCDIRWTERPHKFDIRNFIKELPEEKRKLLMGKTNPKLYTFDIETMTRLKPEDKEEFPNPAEAKFPITTISIASSDCNVLILGTRPLEEGGEKYLTEQFEKYVNDMEYFWELGLKMPYIKYIKFPNEESMLKYFLSNIVAKVPVLAGWNSQGFDWQYIQNRCRGYYPNIFFGSCSMINSTAPRTFTDQRQNKVTLSLPIHTAVIDMMDVIENFDFVVMPIKESMSLDFVASETIHAHKIEYDGSLDDLYRNDYNRYVFYNAIDSFLVQLLDKKFKTMQNIYAQALYCEEMIGKCFSKIALSDALFWDYFYNNGIKVVPEEKHPERDRLVGAYVRIPTPGKLSFVCCNDFASLYPSVIRSTNISAENYIGHFWNETELDKYRGDLNKYIVVGPSVLKNKGTLERPELGEEIGVFLDDAKLDKYRKDPNYFVTVNGCVYKNDKDYAFKIIQTQLASNRNKAKYLYKKMDATILNDTKHLLDGKNVGEKKYDDDVVTGVKEIGYEVCGTKELKELLSENKLKDFYLKLSDEIEYLSSFEQANKYLMNSLYGGSSHVAFFWYNIDLANSITSEARNIIHIMEHHIPQWFKDNWLSDTELHNRLGIKIKKNINSDQFIEVVYGDTDSLYLCYSQLLNTIEDIEKMSLSEKLNILVRLNTEFLDGHNREFMKEYYASRHGNSVQNFELETINKSGVWLDVKKRYAQILLWKDGKTFDIDNLPLKIKGLEMIKSSVPKAAREGLKRIVRFFLEDEIPEYVSQRLNIKMQEEKQKFFAAPLEDICGSTGVNGYDKYIADDTNPRCLQVNPKCPFNVRALGTYNWIRQTKGLPGEPWYGGSKFKWYMFYPHGASRKTDPSYFAFQRGKYPKWANEYAPINKELMFERFMIDPFNRILEAIGYQQLNSDGSIEMNLFDI